MSLSLSQRMARKEQTVIQSQLHDEQDKARRRDSQRLATLHTQQMAEVQAQLEALELQRQNDERKLKDGWKQRDQRLWQRIDAVIRFEEEKVRVRLEAERKAKEEEERRKREEELKRRAEEEKRKQEEERRQKEEEDRQTQIQTQKQKEEEDARQKEEAARARTERLQADEQERKALGLTTAEEDWRHARQTLKVWFDS